MPRAAVSESYEEVAAYMVRKKAATNTNPLKLTSAEKTTLEGAAAQIAAIVAKPSLTAYRQSLCFQATLFAIDAALDGDFQRLVACVEAGLDTSLEIVAIHPYLFAEKDENTLRYFASNIRIALNDMSMRLGLAARGKSRIENDQALCLRAMVNAAIATDRGLMHIAKDNFGAVLNTLRAEDSPLRAKITWTDKQIGYARRFPRTTPRLP